MVSCQSRVAPFHFFSPFRPKHKPFIYPCALRRPTALTYISFNWHCVGYSFSKIIFRDFSRVCRHICPTQYFLSGNRWNWACSLGELRAPARYANYCAVAVVFRMRACCHNSILPTHTHLSLCIQETTPALKETEIKDRIGSCPSSSVRELDWHVFFLFVGKAINKVVGEIGRRPINIHQVLILRHYAPLCKVAQKYLAVSSELHKGNVCLQNPSLTTTFNWNNECFIAFDVVPSLQLTI